MRIAMACLLVSAAVVVSGCGGSNSGTGTGLSTTPPTVTSVTPASGTTGVAVNTALTAAFSQAMNAATITSATFTVSAQGGAAVAGAVSYAAGGSVATFTPSANLAYSTQYTATITTGATDSTGTALSANYSWSFTTAASPAPTVTAVTPTTGSAGVAIASVVTASFSEAMNPATITSSTFTLTPQGGAAVSATVTYSSNAEIATLAPLNPLTYNTQYTATITTGAQSSAGTALAANYTWSFTTVAAPAPTVTSTTPANGATGVSAAAPNITATFSQAMNSSTLTSSTFTLTGGGATVAGAVTYANLVATFTPSATLAYNTLYTATITTGAQSAAGAALAANYTWTFTTGAAPVPTVTSTTPINTATGVSVASIPLATFSQPMNPSTINSSTFTLTAAGGAAVAGTVTYTAGGVCGLVCPPTAYFTPSANLAYNTLYTATITTGAQSSAGAALAANYIWTFTTSAAPPPAVLAVTPANTAAGVAVNTTLTATFSQSMNSSTINTSTFTLAAAGGASVTGTVAFVAATSVATFTPSASLAFGTQYTATITTGVQNASGTALAGNYTWSFTTAAASPNSATVDFGDTLQTIRGFGGSTAWLGQMPQAVATALFSPASGLGLSILRVRIDPEGSPSGGGKYGYPYETGEWDYEAVNGALAVKANPNAIVFATPWTPPASMKTSSASQPYYAGTCGPAAGYCGGYLNPTNYAAYATYLEDFVTFFNSQNSFNLYAISMQNEPEENVSYESCLWTPQQMDQWIDSLVTPGPNPLTAKLIMPEADNFQPAQALTALEDPTAESLISIIGGHLYGVSPAPYSIPAGDTPKEIWMTEYGPLSTAQLTWAQALTYAQSIHQSMVTAQYNAYVWWGIFGDSTGSCATAAGTCGLVDNSGNPSAVGYVMGHFSKFVQPGYTNEGVSASASEDPNVLISAYTGIESGTQHYVIVAINMDTIAVNQSFTLQSGTVTSMTPYLTTSTATAGTGLAPQTPITVTNNAFTYTLPAQSVTTFVQ